MGMYDYSDPGCDPAYCDNISDPPQDEPEDDDDSPDWGDIDEEDWSDEADDEEAE